MPPTKTPTLNRFPLFGLFAYRAARHMGYLEKDARLLGYSTALLYAILTITGSKSEVVLGDLTGAAAPSTADSGPAVAEVAADGAGTSINGIGGIAALLARIRAAEAARGNAAGLPDGVAAAASPAVVPEPSAFALLAVAAVGLLGCAGRRKRT